MQSSIACRFGTGSAPGKARQTGHVLLFSGAPYTTGQRQNIFVLVFRCMWISRPITGSHSAASAIEHLLSLAHCVLDVARDLDHRHAVLERAVGLDQPQLALARLELQLHVADEHGARPVEDARRDAEHALDGGHELGGAVRERPHRSRPDRKGAGTVSNPIACSRAWPTRKSVFSANCGPISCSPTGSPSDRPQGIERRGRPAMHDGIVSRSARYIASGSVVLAPSSKATVGLVGETRRSKRPNASSCSRLITVRTFCAVP